MLMGSGESGEKRFFQPGPGPDIQPSCFRSGNQAELLPQASFPWPAHTCRGPAPHRRRQVRRPMAWPQLPHPSGQAGSRVQGAGPTQEQTGGPWGLGPLSRPSCTPGHILPLLSW